MKRYDSQHFFSLFVCTVILCIAFCSSDEAGGDEEMCDLNTWYIETDAEGVFADADPDVTALEAQIIATLESEGEDYVVPCSVLSGYDEMIYGPPEEEEGEEEGEEGEEEELEEEEGFEEEGEEEEVQEQVEEEKSKPVEKADKEAKSDEKVEKKLEKDSKIEDPISEESEKDSKVEEPSEKSVEDSKVEEPNKKCEKGSKVDEKPSAKYEKEPKQEEMRKKEQEKRSEKPEEPSTVTETKPETVGSEKPKDVKAKEDSDLKPEQNVKVSTAESTQNIVAEIKASKAKEHRKCTLSSQRYEGVLNGCHCSKDSCSWSEIFLTRQSEKAAKVEDVLHTPDTPETASSQTTLFMADAQTMLDLSESKRHLDSLNHAYTSKLQNMEMQILKLENKMLTSKSDRTQEGASITNLENMVLRLENELLRINSSFIILVAENAQLREQVMSEPRGQYPALPDKNATVMSNLVTDHQSRISELSNVITKQSDVIKALDEKSKLLEEQNTQLKDNLVTQSDMIENIMKHIGEIRDMQVKQTLQLNDEKEKIRDMLSSVRLSQEVKEMKIGDDLTPPETMGAPSEVVKNMEELADISLKLPGGKVEKESVAEETVKDQEIPPENPKLPSTAEKEAEETAEIQLKTEEKKEEKAEAKKEVESKKDVKATGAKGDSKAEVVEKESKTQEKPAVKTDIKATPTLKKKTKPTGKGKKGTVKKGKKKGTKGKGKGKVVKKKTTGKKKTGKKVIKKEKPVPVPPAMFIDKEYKGMKDCLSHYEAGRKRDSPLRIRPVGMTRESDVFCDMKNGGWTVILRRQDGATDFYREWSEYKRGFGGTYTDHWLGLELIHRVTNQGDYQLRVELTDWQRNSAFALYDLFRVESGGDGYRLYITGYSGTAGDGFQGHNGMKFSTKDRDNDLATTDFGGSCAKKFHGGWWYSKCYKSNLTGRYYRGGNAPEGLFDGISWKAWTGSKISLKKVEMKIRPKL